MAALDKTVSRIDQTRGSQLHLILKKGMRYGSSTCDNWREIDRMGRPSWHCFLMKSWKVHCRIGGQDLLPPLDQRQDSRPSSSLSLARRYSANFGGSYSRPTTPWVVQLLTSDQQSHHTLSDASGLLSSRIRDVKMLLPPTET